MSSWKSTYFRASFPPCGVMDRDSTGGIQAYSYLNRTRTWMPAGVYPERSRADIAKSPRWGKGDRYYYGWWKMVPTTPISGTPM